MLENQIRITRAAVTILNKHQSASPLTGRFWNTRTKVYEILTTATTDENTRPCELQLILVNPKGQTIPAQPRQDIV